MSDRSEGARYANLVVAIAAPSRPEQTCLRFSGCENSSFARHWMKNWEKTGNSEGCDGFGHVIQERNDGNGDDRSPCPSGTLQHATKIKRQHQAGDIEPIHQC